MINIQHAAFSAIVAQMFRQSATSLCLIGLSKTDDMSLIQIKHSEGPTQPVFSIPQVKRRSADIAKPILLR